MARADFDLREGNPHLCTIFGMGHSPPYIDATLGIPRLWAGTCVHDDADQVYYEGYVARLAQYGQLRGLPPNSRRPWLAHILAPRRYFRQSGPPISLRPGSTSVLRTPSGSLSIRLSTEEKGVVTLTCRDERSSEFKYPVEASRVEFVWGPPGSRTVFVRAIGRGNRESHAVLATDQSWLMNYVGEAHWFWEPMPRKRGGDFGTTCPSAP